MDHNHHFKRALLRMIQDGTLQEIMGCQDGECEKLEFHLQRIYHVHLARRYIVVHERDVETIRRHTSGRWRRMRPMIFRRGKIVIDRTSGKILQAPSLGVIQVPSRRPQRRVRVP